MKSKSAWAYLPYPCHSKPVCFLGGEDCLPFHPYTVTKSASKLIEIYYNNYTE